MQARSFLRDSALAIVLSIVPPLLALLLAPPPCQAAHLDHPGTREIRLQASSLFDGALLPAGLYELAWGTNRDGERVEVRLYQGRRMLRSAQGRVIELATASPHDSVLFTRARNGERELSEIRFSGSSSAIELVAVR
jgi:hypothetical protein